MADTSDEKAKVEPADLPDVTHSPGSKLDQIVSRIESEDGATAPGGARDGVDRPVEPAGSRDRQSAPRRRGGFLGVFLGGVCAAALGFASAIYVLPKLPQEWLPLTDGATATQAVLDAQAARIESMAQEIANLQQAPAPIDAARLDSELARLRDDMATARPAPPDLGPLEARLTDLDARLTTIEKRPVAGGAASSTAIDALSRELGDLRAQMARQTGGDSDAAARIAVAAAQAQEQIQAAVDAAAKLKSDAEDIARKQSARSAVRLVQAALESGAPFDRALGELAAAGVEVPAELTQDAGGLPSLDQLRTDFPEAARSALVIAARPAPDAGALDRLGAFLRGQTGARSLTPREGSDPDAILSRAEAALKIGDLSAALVEVRSLPPEVQAPMSSWIASANRLQAALDAATALSATVN